MSAIIFENRIFINLFTKKVFAHTGLSHPNTIHYFETKREELEAAFAQYSQVLFAKIIRDKDTGRSKGFGFVECQTMKRLMQQ